MHRKHMIKLACILFIILCFACILLIMYRSDKIRQDRNHVLATSLLTGTHILFYEISADANSVEHPSDITDLLSKIDDESALKELLWNNQNWNLSGNDFENRMYMYNHVIFIANTHGDFIQRLESAINFDNPIFPKTLHVNKDTLGLVLIYFDSELHDCHMLATSNPIQNLPLRGRGKTSLPFAELVTKLGGKTINVNNDDIMTVLNKKNGALAGK